MNKLAQNAEYFERKAPWLEQYKKKSFTPPVVKAVEVLIETGDFQVSTIGDNLPNENQIHEKYGTKNFLFTASSRAFDEAAGHKSIQEFGATQEIIDRNIKYGQQAEELLTAMHEVIGHGSGKLSPKLTRRSGALPEGVFLDPGRRPRGPFGLLERVGPEAQGAGPRAESGRGRESDVRRSGADHAAAAPPHSEG